MDFLHSSAVILEKILGQVVSLRLTTLSILKEKKAHFWLTYYLELPMDVKYELFTFPFKMHPL